MSQFTENIHDVSLFSAIAPGQRKIISPGFANIYSLYTLDCYLAGFEAVNECSNETYLRPPEK